MQWAAITISLISFGVSAATLWLTFFKRGEVRMTQPAVIYFGPERDGKPQVFLRALLYSTSKRGQLVEHMYATLWRGETRQNFSIWTYGEKQGLVRGSGLFVGEAGIACNHHFLLPSDDAQYLFREGDYKLQIFVQQVGRRSVRQLAEVGLRIDASVASDLKDGAAGVYFDWGPDAKKYLTHVQHGPDPRREAEELLRYALRSPEAQQGQ